MEAMLPAPTLAPGGRMTNGKPGGRVARRTRERSLRHYFKRCAQYTSTSVRGWMSVLL